MSSVLTFVKRIVLLPNVATCHHHSPCSSFLSSRSFSSSKSLKSGQTKIQPEEIKLDLPWGQIAGKTWGSGSIPILALHGWLDNACTFDRLAPYLPLDQFKLYCLDLPGHGWSQHIPIGMNYTMTDGLVIVKQTQEHFNWQSSICLGHSMGAGVSCLFASAFPERVSRLIMIDFIGFGSLPLRKHARATRKAVEMSIDLNNKVKNTPESKLPRYDRLDAVARAFMANTLMHGTDSISKESVEILMQRGLREVEKGKFTWTADLRLRAPSAFNLLADQAEHYASQVDCPQLLLKASDSPLYMSEDVAERILAAYKNNNPDYVFQPLKNAGHHVHLDEPERVAKHINKFLGRDFKNKGTEEKENYPFKL